MARNKFESQDLEPILQQLLNAQGDVVDINGPQLLAVYDLIQDEKLEEANQLFINKALPRQKTILELINSMVNYQFGLEQQELKQAETKNQQIHFVIISINIFILFLSILLTLYILKKQRKHDKNLRIKAATDTLTGLPNRLRMIKNIDLFIKQQPTHTFAVLFLDINFFKCINDNNGHSVGDLVLKKFAEKIKLQINKNDVLSRFGGDEFVLLLRSIKSEIEARRFVKKLSAELNTSFNINNKEIFITLVSVCVYTILIIKLKMQKLC